MIVAATCIFLAEGSDGDSLRTSTDAAQSSQYTFLSIGDWGGAAVSHSIKENVYAVASEMKKTAAQNQVPKNDGIIKQESTEARGKKAEMQESRKHKFLNILMTKSFNYGLNKIADAFQKRAEDLFVNT